RPPMKREPWPRAVTAQSHRATILQRRRQPRSRAWPSERTTCVLSELTNGPRVALAEPEATQRRRVGATLAAYRKEADAKREIQRMASWRPWVVGFAPEASLEPQQGVSDDARAEAAHRELLAVRELHHVGAAWHRAHLGDCVHASERTARKPDELPMRDTRFEVFESVG